ncbi:MAG: IS1595 family transposase [Aestuariivirga sp.]
MSNAFNALHFTNDEAARKMIEGVRWPDGPVCPHCGVIDHSYVTKRPGVYRCAEPDCRKDFSVTTDTVMERSKIPLHKWMMGFYLMCASKKGVSAHQLHRSLGITYQSAWFMCHRIREAMKDGGLVPLGGGGSIVEADETYHGKIEGEIKHSRKRYNWKPTKGGHVGPGGKRAIVSLVERGGGVRSFHVAIADKKTINKIVTGNIDSKTRVHTDESRLYGEVRNNFLRHETVKHSRKEYVRGDVHTNSVEGFFSIFKRGMHGVYQHCAEKHLHRYLAEFDFRYNHRSRLGIGDIDRTFAALRGAEGKRLLYRQPS